MFRAVDEGRTVIPRADIDVLFGNVKTLLSVNAELLRTLEARLCRIQTKEYGRPTGDEEDAIAVAAPVRLSEAISTSFDELMPYFRTYTVVSTSLLPVGLVSIWHGCGCGVSVCWCACLSRHDFG